jgi:hypothetical protein
MFDGYELTFHFIVCFVSFMVFLVIIMVDGYRIS